MEGTRFNENHRPSSKEPKATSIDYDQHTSIRILTIHLLGSKHTRLGLPHPFMADCKFCVSHQWCDALKHVPQKQGTWRQQTSIRTTRPNSTTWVMDTRRFTLTRWLINVHRIQLMRIHIDQEAGFSRMMTWVCQSYDFLNMGQGKPYCRRRRLVR